MIGLRGGESGKAYRLGRPYNSEGTSIGRTFRQTGGIAGHHGIQKGSKTVPDALTTPSIPGRCQTPVDKPIRLEKVRRQRSCQTSPASTGEQTPTICSQTNTEASESRKLGRRGITFPRLTLRKRISAQEIVSLVKDAYYSRPSLNLSRSRVAPDLGGEHSRSSSDGARMPTIQAWRSNITASKDLSTHPCNDQRDESLASSSSFGRTVFRKLSTKHKRTLRPKRRSRSLDDNSSLSINRRTSIASNATVTSVLKDSPAGSGSASVSSIVPVACKYGPMRSTPLIPLAQLSSRQQDTIIERQASAPSARLRTTCVGENATLQVQITPELRELDVTATATFWVAIQARHFISQSVYERTKHAPVRFVILIDNASYTSNLLALARSCTLVFAIAYHLTHLADCLAVFATSCCHDDSAGVAGCQLHPLKTPTMRILRKELDILRSGRPKYGGDSSSAQHSASDRLSHTLDSIMSLVMEDGPGDRDLWNYQFVILSGNRIDTTVRCGSTVTVHHIDPAWLEYMGPPCMSRIELRYPLELIQDWANHLVQNARASVEAQPLRNVTIDVQPGLNTNLLRVVGNSSRNFLAAGQEISLVVELVVTEINPGRLFTADAELDDIYPALTVEEALDDLRYMLGETLHSTLVVTSSFQGSHARDEYEDSQRHTSVDRICGTIKRCNAASVWSATRFNDDPSIVGETLSGLEDRLHVHMLLVSELACASRVEEGMDLLVSIEAHSYLPQDISNQFNILRTRLLQVLFALHTNALASYDNTVTQASPLDSCPVNQRNGDLHASPCQETNTVPEPDKNRAHSSPPPASKENDDAARKIWRLMRRDSKTHRRLELVAANEELHDLESRSREARQMRRRALINQRSVGADTLRSLALSPVIGGATELTAPWM